MKGFLSNTLSSHESYTGKDKRGLVLHGSELKMAGIQRFGQFCCKQQLWFSKGLYFFPIWFNFPYCMANFTFITYKKRLLPLYVMVDRKIIMQGYQPPKLQIYSYWLMVMLEVWSCILEGHPIQTETNSKPLSQLRMKLFLRMCMVSRIFLKFLVQFYQKISYIFGSQ